MINKDLFKAGLNRNALSGFGKEFVDCNDKEKYVSLSKTVMDDVLPLWNTTTKKEQKKAYYLSAEFLMGRALSNNLINFGVKSEITEVLKEMGVDYNIIEEAEDDAGLGNGGLGRLAACFLDSAATLDLPLIGYGIRYEYGIFKQNIIDGFQVEEGDNWLSYGDPWSVRCISDAVEVVFGDQTVKAVPYDTPIIGYGTKNINTLRLWRSEAVNDFDFKKFDSQDYDDSVKEKNDAETITKVLYPNDNGDEGKKLRLKQQYFFVSASLQDLVRKHKANHKDFSNFHELHAVQLNDTHPAVAVPELIRLLVNGEGMSFEEAFEIGVKTFAYTNHTILAEALEQWSVKMYKELVPDVYEMIVKINEKLVKEFTAKGISKDDMHKYEIIHNGMIKMAWLSIYGTHATNGVARLHTDILIDKELNDWYEIYPERFQNKTNGITQRRWLLHSNPQLSDYITELLGSDAWIKNLDELKNLEKFIDDEKVLNKFMDIKKDKKQELVDFVKEHDGVELNVDSIFDIQIKRLHEYKRQLLNAFQILDMYYRIKENPKLDIHPRTFIFGAKAAPGYFRAKGIIKFINEIANLVNNDDDVNDKLKVIFVENYRVTYGEKLFPACDISEQISTAGKEASGTGNMKFMLNGAPTIGTLDGANVEIAEEAGIDNNFIFGARVEEIKEIKATYDPNTYYESVEGLKRVVDSLIDGTFSDEGTGMFKELHDSILKGATWHEPDVYFLMRDFDDYRNAQMDVDAAYRNRIDWAKKCWMNIANAGKFSSDRTIEEYAKDIWEIKKY